MFLIFWTPNFIPNFRKIVAAVPEIIRSVRTDGQTYESDSISPAVCNLGPTSKHRLVPGGTKSQRKKNSKKKKFLQKMLTSIY